MEIEMCFREDGSDGSRTPEFTSYRLRLALSWCESKRMDDLLRAFMDEYARTRPEKGIRGDLKLLTTDGTLLEAASRCGDVLRNGMLVLVRFAK